MSHEVNRSLMHPLMRARAVALDYAITAAGLPMRLYEGYRGPARQAALFARGRAGGIGVAGKHVTNARPWTSYHQYGLAGDWVFLLGPYPGVWTWLPKDDSRWVHFAELAADAGLECLDSERPHAQLPLASLGLNLADLTAGHQLAGGDASYLENLHAEIFGWGQKTREIYGLPMPGAPPWLDPAPPCERPVVA